MMILFKEDQTYGYHFLESGFSLAHDLYVVPNSPRKDIQTTMDMKYVIKT